MSNLSNFGERLSELIFDNKITYQNLADKMNVTLQCIYRWKANKKDIGLSHLLALARYFNCSLEYLTGRSDSESVVNHSKPLPSFSDSVRAVMSAKGISTYALQQTSHFDTKSLTTWKRGADPKLSTLIELAGLFDCTLDYLVGLE